MLRSSAPLSFVAACLAMLAGVLPHTALAQPAPGSLTVAEETVTWDDGTAMTFERGALTAPVNRARGSEATITVEVVRFLRTAEASPETPPIFVLRGGPGYGGIDGELDTSNYYRLYIRPFLDVADVVIVGQRGFGTSTDTPCDDREALSLDDAFDDNLREQANRAAMDRCRAKWEAEGLDLTGFNIIEAAGDVADAAQALGYDEIQLFGNSFGTHHGIAVMRYYPDLVTRVTFGALEGPDHTYDSPSGLLNSLENIAVSVAQSEVLAPHLPEEGLLEAYRALIAQADAEPVVVETEHPDTGEPITVRLDGNDFRELSRGTTRGLAWRYIMDAWPLDLLAMLDGDYEDAARRIFRLNMRTGQRNAAFYQLDCASGITAERGALYRSSPAADLLGPLGRWYDVECEAWDADLGDDFRTGFVTDIPAVLMHGTWDMNTPYENALDLLPDFRDRHVVTVVGGSHGALWEATEVNEVFTALLQWMATGDASGLPDRVVLPRMEWRAPEE
ncbi:MAG: alpha/beta fold hydrolase [Bacteroidota bacterium]